MDLAITDNNGKELKINNLDESIKYAEESSKGQGDYWFDIHTKLTNIKEKHLKEFKDDILNVAEKYDIQNRLIYAKNHKGDTIDYEYNNNNDLIKKTTNFRNGDSTTLYNTFEKQQYTGESIKTAVKQVTKTKDGVESEEMFGDKFQYHIHEKYDNENQLLFKQTHYYNKTTTEHYYDKSTTGHWTYDNNQKELSYISFTDNVSVNNTSHNILIGGSSNNVAGKILSDKNYLYLFDKGVQDLINEFINTTDKKITPIQLEADDKLALSVLWKKEIDNPTQISNGMNKTQIEAISEKYYNLFEEDLFQNDKKRFGELIINGYENDLKLRKEQNKEFINSKQQNDMENNVNQEQENTTIAPQNLPVDENLQKLQDKVKYLGLGDTQEMRDKIAQIYHGDLGKSQINTSSNRVMVGNKAEFTLNFNKTEKGVFFNSYDAKLTTKQGEERSHTFNVQNNNVTSKEAINLLEGRAVKMNFQKLDTETGEITENQAFIKLKLKDEKTDKGNYKLEGYNVNSYGIGIDKIMEKSNIKGTPQELENVKKHLEKGNITSVTFQHEQKEIKGYAVFNPQWKMLNLYDEKMSRVNTNKDSQAMNMNGNEKNNVREQSQKRTL